MKIDKLEMVGKGQFYKSFLCFKYIDKESKCMVLFDQHGICERIIYEGVYENIDGFSSIHRLNVKKIKVHDRRVCSYFEKYGYLLTQLHNLFEAELEYFKTNKINYILITVNKTINFNNENLNSTDIVNGMIRFIRKVRWFSNCGTEYDIKSVYFISFFDECIKKYSCNKAIRLGRKLDKDRVEEVLNKRKSIERYNKCVHGRNVISIIRFGV
eukprot:GAHX01000037.1.p1 GENE.GAHX01000037.1~~GAHX01000037.1.p1  ORF type:complete len:213 (-),score=35.14 GAHX01000037.1:821-1459(-)